MRQIVPGPPTRPSYAWDPEVEVEGFPQPPFPDGCTLRATVRLGPWAPVIADLTTENGGIMRISDTAVRFNIPAAATRILRDDIVMLDIARTDPVGQLFIDIRFEIPVENTNTKAL